jgi:hypothetical protein
VGSGTIISPEGYVLTNFHVARNGRKFVCTLSDKQEITAELVGEDPLTDLAVLKLDLDELENPAIPRVFWSTLWAKMVLLQRPAEAIKARYEMDPVGHYSRPDIFKLSVDERPPPAVSSIDED